MTGRKVSHAAAWGGGLGPPAAPVSAIADTTPAKRAKPAPRVRSDESIGRPEDIGSLVPTPPSPTPGGNGNNVPLAPTATRTKPVRVTLDLDQTAYKELNQWLGTAAAEVGAPVSKARALRAMIRAVTLDKSIGLIVIDLLRRDT